MALFIGDSDSFQTLAAIVSFIGGIYAIIRGPYVFYQHFLQRPKLLLYPGDQIRIIKSNMGDLPKFHLKCSLLNKSIKTAILHHLEASMLAPDGKVYLFSWNLFFAYADGGQVLQKESDPYPIPVSSNDALPLSVEFIFNWVNEPLYWQSGSYRIDVNGWANREKRDDASNVHTTFHVDVTDQMIQAFGFPQNQFSNHEWTAVPVPIKEWRRNEE